MSPYKKLYRHVLNFWFTEIDRGYWFKKSHQFDHLIKQRFINLHYAATQNELFPWRDTIEGRLAEIIILDQFSRNIFRNQPLAFAFDNLALALAQEAVAHTRHLDLDANERAFLYMPFMHSESLIIQAQSVELFNQPDLQSSYRFARYHKEIIERFGRYPHRNEILGRDSTQDELAFLAKPGSKF